MHFTCTVQLLSLITRNLICDIAGEGAKSEGGGERLSASSSSSSDSDSSSSSSSSSSSDSSDSEAG